MESSDDLRSEYFKQDEGEKGPVIEHTQPSKPNNDTTSDKIPLHMWIIGLTAPTIFACLCVAAILLGYNLRKNLVLKEDDQARQVPTQVVYKSDTNLPESAQTYAFTLLDSESAMAMISPMDNTIFRLEDNANESYKFEDYFRMGTTRNYTINLMNSRYASVSAWWCARNSRILKNNLTDMDISISIDGRPIDLKKEAAWWELTRDENTQCQFIEVVAHNWGEGEHTITTSIKVKEKINNGFQDYLPGENNGVYKLTVLSSKEVLLNPVQKK